MRKSTKFGFDSTGNLVYRSTGRKVAKNLAEKYYVDRAKKTVYAWGDRKEHGPKIGTIGKGTPKERKVIKQKEEARIKREEARVRAVKRKFKKSVIPKLKVKDTIKPGPQSYPVKEPYAPTAELYDVVPAIDKIEKGLLDAEQRGIINFAKSLDTCVKAGYIEEDTATELFNQYLRENKKGKKKLWNQLHDYYEDVGYRDSR